MGERTVVVGSSTEPEDLVLRRRDLSAQWWLGPALGVVGLVSGGVLLALDAGSGPEGSSDPLPWLAVLAASVVSLVLFARQRLWVDATGIGWRWVRSEHIAWPDLAGVYVLDRERGGEHLLAVRVDGSGQVLGRVANAAALATAIERRRPHDAAARHPAPPPAPAGGRPGRIMATAAVGSWSVGAAAHVAYIVVLVGTGIAASWIDTSLRLLFAGGSLLLTLGLAVSFRQTRAAIAADGDSFMAIRASRVERLPMRSVERFVDAELFPQRTLAVALVDGRARGFDVPLGTTSKASELVEHLERLRAWSAAHPDDLPGPDDHDPRFRTRRPGPVARKAIPLLGFVIAALLMAYVPVAFVAAEQQRSDTAIRSLPTRGVVDATTAGSITTFALVDYPTSSGTRTIELALEPEEIGQRSLALRYDPDRPDRVWREGASPDLNAWPFVVAMLAFVPLAIGTALALRWHPPSATGRRPGLYDAPP